MALILLHQVADCRCDRRPVVALTLMEMGRELLGVATVLNLK